MKRKLKMEVERERNIAWNNIEQYLGFYWNYENEEQEEKGVWEID